MLKKEWFQDETPQELLEQIAGYLDTHPKWDVDTILVEKNYEFDVWDATVFYEEKT